MRDKKLEDVKRFGKFGYILSTIFIALAIVVLVLLVIVNIFVNSKHIPLEEIKINSTNNIEVSFTGALDRKELEDALDKLIIDADEYGKLSSAEIEVRDDKTYVSFEGDISKNIVYRDVIKLLYLPFLALIIIIINTILFRKIFKSLRDEASPFNQVTIKHVRIFAYSLIPWVFMSNIESLIKALFRFDTNIELGINVTAVFFVVIVLLLAKIFEYGMDLQQEADEIV